MTYIDGMIAAVPADGKQAYLEFAKRMAPVFLDHGALRVVENWADNVPEGETTSFTMAVQRKDDEIVVFTWIEWPSKEARDAGWGRAMEDERMQGGTMPFDGKRMIFGGFATILDTASR